MFRPLFALVLLSLGVPALADDGGIHPAMACPPEDQACIDRANREYEAAQRARRGGAALPAPSGGVRPTSTEVPPAIPASGAETEREASAGEAEARRGTRTFYRDEGLYVAVWTVDNVVQVVEAHPIAVVERAADGLESADLPEEDAAMLERSAQTWQDLAQPDLPDEAERQIRLEPVPAG